VFPVRNKHSLLRRGALPIRDTHQQHSQSTTLTISTVQPLFYCEDGSRHAPSTMK